MNSPHIRNEERSSGEQVLTVNRFAAILAGALGIVLALLPAAVLYTQSSNQYAVLRETVGRLDDALENQATNRENYRAAIEVRLRNVEDRVSGSQRDLSHALATWDRIDTRLQRLEERLFNGQSTPR